jgi:DNA polymerase/3'-5' exonuclease PolX
MNLPAVIHRKKYPRETALKVAEELKAILGPACHQIAIVGSLRRGKAEVHDAELLYVPRFTERPEDMFASRFVDLAEEVTDKLLADGVLKKRPNINGHFAWGSSNKLAIHVASGLPVDLFTTTEKRWWVALVIRTGSKETNLRLTTGAIKQGRKLNAYGEGVTMPDGTVTPAFSEKSVFDLCGVPYLQPEKR